MKMKHMLAAIVLLGLVLGQDAFAHYNPSTGRWLSRDPLNAVPGVEARYNDLVSHGVEESLAKSIALNADEGNDYVFVRNCPLTYSDVLGFGLFDGTLIYLSPCQFAQSGEGDVHTQIILHNLGFNITGTETFQFNCPIARPHLWVWRVAANTAPPLPTPHGNTFPASWTTINGPSGSGPSYTITIQVTTSQSFGYWYSSDPFVRHIRIVGLCCSCVNSRAPVRFDTSDPPPLPDPPAPPKPQPPPAPYFPYP